TRDKRKTADGFSRKLPHSVLPCRNQPDTSKNRGRQTEFSPRNSPAFCLRHRKRRNPDLPRESILQLERSLSSTVEANDGFGSAPARDRDDFGQGCERVFRENLNRFDAGQTDCSFRGTRLGNGPQGRSLLSGLFRYGWSGGAHLYSLEALPGRRSLLERGFGEHEQSEHGTRHRGKRSLGGRARGTC